MTITAPVADTEHTTGAARRERTIVALFAGASFLSAALLFLVELIAARMLLPRLGGTASVWNTSMVFFQLVLLAGYAWAHVATRTFGPSLHRVSQVILVAGGISAVPVAIPTDWDPVGVDAALWVVLVLTVTVGLPFFALSTIGPTLQRWYSAAGQRRSSDPYFLYAAGNAGSLLALVSYPLVVEPNLGLSDQARMWGVAYAALIGLIVLCALVPARLTASEVGANAVPTTHSTAVADPLASRPDLRTRVRWAAMAAAPSALLLGVTRHISTDLASIPLFWIVPLAIYLASFIVAFGPRSDRWPAPAARVLRLLAVVVVLSGPTQLPLILQVTPHLLLFAAASVFVHARLAKERPAPAHLTDFYLCLSAGGVIGGAAASVIAPLVFPVVLEYPLAIALTALLLPRTSDARGPRPYGLLAALAAIVAAATFAGLTDVPRPLVYAGFGVAAVVGYVRIIEPRPFAVLLVLIVVPIAAIEFVTPIAVERTFFGVYRVFEDGGVHYLQSGTTVHGGQEFLPEPSLVPRTYYAPDEGIGRFFESVATVDEPRTVGVIGLGTGALAGYGRAGDHFDFYEIDEAVVDIAFDPDLFTYLTDTPAAIDTIVGDGRIQLDRTETRYDVLVLDAFSSDSIPVHLLTSEAFDVYASHLLDGGVIAVHISNRYFDLEGVLAAQASRLGLDGSVYRGPAATWVFLTSDALPDALADDPATRPLVADGTEPWTDDYSDLLGALDL